MGFVEAIEAARAVLVEDGGLLWGVSMATVPWLIYDGDRIWLTEDPGIEGYEAAHGLWCGPRPAGIEPSNTALAWAGRRWATYALPLPDDPVRALVHEAFHVIQGQLMEPSHSTVTGSSGFDTVAGRVSLRLEMEALARALGGEGDAVAHAVAFHDRRVRTREAERDLELWEGLAEYTGWRLSGATNAEVAAYLRRPAPDSWRRFFALRTGPAYGFLLDERNPGWRTRVRDAASLHLLLDTAGIDDTTGYDSESICTQEHRRQAGIDAVTTRFATETLLRIRPRTMSVVFDPGRVYPHAIYGALRWSDPDGARPDAPDGAQISDDWSELRVPLGDAQVATGTTYGDGWTLTLPPGWLIATEGPSVIVRPRERNVTGRR